MKVMKTDAKTYTCWCLRVESKQLPALFTTNHLVLVANFTVAN